MTRGRRQAGHGVLLVHRLACEVAGARPGVDDPAEVVREFFDSDAFKAVPFLDIAARLWATIAQQARSPEGAEASEGRGSLRCAGLVNPRPLLRCHDRGQGVPGHRFRRERRCPGEIRRAALLSTLDGFLDYLQGIEDRMTPEHREVLASVHLTCARRFTPNVPTHEPVG